MENYGFYAAEPNLILVKDSNRKEIIDTVKKLYEQKYFEGIKFIEYIDINQLVKIL